MLTLHCLYAFSLYDLFFPKDNEQDIFIIRSIEAWNPSPTSQCVYKVKSFSNFFSTSIVILKIQYSIKHIRQKSQMMFGA